MCCFLIYWKYVHPTVSLPTDFNKSNWGNQHHCAKLSRESKARISNISALWGLVGPPHWGAFRPPRPPWYSRGATAPLSTPRCSPFCFTSGRFSLRSNRPTVSGVKPRFFRCWGGMSQNSSDLLHIWSARTWNAKKIFFRSKNYDIRYIEMNFR